MIRVVYSNDQIFQILPNNPDGGITYTTQRVIVCTKEEAYAFFAGHSLEEIEKLDRYFEEEKMFNKDINP